MANENLRNRTRRGSDSGSEDQTYDQKPIDVGMAPTMDKGQYSGYSAADSKKTTYRSDEE